MKKAIIFSIIPPGKSQQEAKREMDELTSLVKTYGGIVILEVLQKRGRPSAKTYLGEGKAREVAQIAKERKADMVILNDFIKPAQMQHLSKIFSYDPNDITGKSNIPIWDRTDIILNIFEKHATTQEAKLQIKLAQLKHQIPKVYHYQTNLFDKERGGISGTRGAGEKGIEQEKRHIRSQIKETERKLENVKKTQENQRKRRKREGLKTIALVGYTNAGKSTLLTALTKKKVYRADELFATLDTRLASLWIPHPKSSYKGQKILLADTIGFIQNLPPHLIESFQATLAEVQQADGILHIIDGSDLQQRQKKQVVEEILKELLTQDIPIIPIYSKKDQQEFCSLEQKGKLCISVKDHQSLQELKDLLSKSFTHFDYT